MNLPNSRKTNSAIRAVGLQVPVHTDYQPEAGSALGSVYQQGRGSVPDERSLNDVRKHTHDGANSQNINIKNLIGFIPTVAAVPLWIPKAFSEQLAVYKNGVTIRLYIYDTANNVWRYTALT